MATTTKAAKHETLVEALAAFQADLPAIDLDSTNPHFKSKYASLGNITKKVLPKLAEHGLAFSVGSFVDNGLLVVDAHLIHTSGQSRSAQFPIVETNPQKVGGAVTYYRRYALAALTGIVADEDDDGNAASQPTVAEKKIEAARKTPTRNATTAKTDGASQAAIREWINGDNARRDEANALREKHQAAGLKGDAIFDAVKAELGI